MSTSSKPNKEIVIRPMCAKHRSLLMDQANYSPKDPWMALEIATGISLFQAATANPKTYERIGGDITKIESLGCLACYQPDVFGEIVEAAKSHEIKKVKAIGEAHLEKHKVKMVPVKEDAT